MSTEQDSTFEDPTEIMATTPMEDTHQTTGNSMTSSPSRGVGFYLECAVLVIGVVGTAVNALVLYAMVVSKQHKKQVLIFNQNLLDFANGFFLFTMNVVRLCYVFFGGTIGHWLCLVIFSEFFNWAPFLGSLINLAAVHPCH